jgi:hypothetical protein
MTVRNTKLARFRTDFELLGKSGGSVAGPEQYRRMSLPKDTIPREFHDPYFGR